MTSYYKFGKLLGIMIVLQILNKVQTQHPNDLNFKQLYRYTDEPMINVLKPGSNEYSFMELEIPISFYSKTYHRIYINTNGILTFDKKIPYFSDRQFSSKIPSIAPFFANVDTSVPSNSTIISLFKSQNHEKLHKANSLVRKKYSNNFEATILYVATWENVGYYHAKTDKLNTFQAIIICNSDESYVQFIYPEEGINWLQAESGQSGNLDFPAQAGFASDDRRYFMINGSGTEKVANLSKMSNIGINGVFLYRVGLLDFDSNISDEDNNGTINENVSPMSCAKAGRLTCHSSASCIDKTKGFYCKCFEGFYGNGHSCIRNTKTISIYGSLNGQINNRSIERDAKIESIISMDKGVSETAIRPISGILEGQLKLAVPVFSSFGWLVAKPLSPKFMNGYQWTGGKFVHSSELTFESGEILHINQTFEVNDRQQTVKIDINGFVPEIGYDEEIEIPGYIKELQFASPNTISSTVEHYVEIPSKNKTIKFQLSQNISFESCNSCYSNEINVTDITSLERVSRTSLKLTPVPYSLRSTKMIAKIGDEDTLNPCFIANCWKFSSCVPDEDSYKCVCAIGLETNVTEDGVECVDVDECQNELSPCNDDGYCVNVLGGYSCFCNDPNESDCVRKIEADDLSYSTEQREDCYDNPKLCSDNASCIRSKIDRVFECICNPGFYSSDNSRNVCKEETCKQNPSLCHPNANCHSINGTNTCVCKTGYQGNGTTCIKTEFFLSANHKIQKLSFDGKLITVVENEDAKGIDIDCIEGRVYYFKLGKIFSANYDGTDSRSFINEDISDSHGLAIDSISRLIYWISSAKRAIEVASLNNPKMKTALETDESLGWLRNIAVDPIRGKLYWLTRFFNTTIKMSELDGTAREILFTIPEDLNIQSMAVLLNSGDLCFNGYDGEFKLMCIDFHSKEVRNIAVTSSSIDRITATNNSIYWHNYDSKAFEGVYSDGTRHRSIHFDPGYYVDKLIALEDYCPQGINPCQMNNGGCPLDTICLPNRSSSSGISCKQIKLT